MSETFPLNFKTFLSQDYVKEIEGRITNVKIDKDGLWLTIVPEKEGEEMSFEQEFDGKRVKSIRFPMNGYGGNEIIKIGERFDKMIYYQQYLGDCGIDWIQCFKGNKLICQYNAKYLESIKFEDRECK